MSSWIEPVLGSGLSVLLKDRTHCLRRASNPRPFLDRGPRTRGPSVTGETALCNAKFRRPLKLGNIISQSIQASSDVCGRWASFFPKINLYPFETVYMLISFFMKDTFILGTYIRWGGGGGYSFLSLIRRLGPIIYRSPKKYQELQAPPPPPPKKKNKKN